MRFSHYTQKTRVWIKNYLGRLLLARPEASLRLAGTVGRRFGSCPGLKVAPSPREVATLFEELPRSSLAGICREIGAHERQNQALFALTSRRGVEPLLPLVRVVGEEHLIGLRQQGVPAILVDWHVGVPLANIAGLIKLGVSAISLHLNDPFPSRYPLPESIRLIVGGDQSVTFLMKALEHLRKGGIAIIGINGTMGDASLEVSFLGRRVRVGRGAGALARLSGASFLPITTRWAGRGDRIDFAIHEPLPPPPVDRKARSTYEDALLTTAARWYENYVRSHPDQLRLRWIHEYLEAEPYPSPSGGEPAPS